MPLVEVPVTLWKVYQESPGVYFEHLGHVTLSHTSWTLVVRGLLEKYPTFGREKETGLLGALDT